MVRADSDMSIKIADIMSKRVITAQPHHSVEHVRGLMERNRIKAVPIVDDEGKALGIVTTTDLVTERKKAAPVSGFMTTDIKVVPAYNDPSAAARIMRRNKIHHVVVTHEKKVLGILSSFDLLKLVEGHSFVMKNAAPAATKGKGAKRRGGDQP